jgi:hypothetical protein
LGRGEVRTGVLLENRRESIYFIYLCVDERIMLKWIFKEWDGGGGVEWIELAQDRES